MKYCKDSGGNVYQLQRCPFCGMDVAEIYTQSERDEIPIDPERYTVVCAWSKNGCGATCGFHESVSSAVSRWNARVVI
jgi:hypothetical protein